VPDYNGEPVPSVTDDGKQNKLGDMPFGAMAEAGSEMPRGIMESQAEKTASNSPASDMPHSMNVGENGVGAGGNKRKVIVELRVPAGFGAMEALQSDSVQNITRTASFELDSGYGAIPIEPAPQHEAALHEVNEQVVVVRGTIDENKISELEAQPNVLRVLPDTPIAHFSTTELPVSEQPVPLSPGLAVCPIPPCDCSSGTAHGTIGNVASYLGVDQIWAKGYRGRGIVVGIVDGGITAIGRTPRTGETAKIQRVIGGFPSDWGTTAAAWGDHGNMTSTDVLGMAPQAQIYDIRVSGGDTQATISAAIAGFQWAIEQHRRDGTPQILSNSWGIFQKSWDPVYATDPTHPFTRKAVQALDEGIIVLFAAGNCGASCPDGRCGSSTGPGNSIWGANGHPRVMTVAAVNKDEQYVGYSSAGPASLDPHKPDFCSITHFTGYFTSDSGTSAATPIAAGCIALLKESNPSASADQIKAALQATAKDIGPPGWDQYSGAGIIRPKEAFDRLAPAWHGWEDLGGILTSGPAVTSWAANRLDCFAKGGDNRMWHKWWDGAAWRGWEDLGGVIDDNPAAVSWGPNRIDCFARGMDNHMWHKWWDGTAWHGWEDLGGVITSGPAVASWSANRLDCFAKGGDNHMWHKWWDGAAWRGWEDLGGVIDDNSAASSWSAGRIDTFVRGMDNHMWHKWFS
jgi:hypothetical protein